jgi:hypothetical protein
VGWADCRALIIVLSWAIAETAGVVVMLSAARLNNRRRDVWMQLLHGTAVWGGCPCMDQHWALLLEPRHCCDGGRIVNADN